MKLGTKVAALGAREAGFEGSREKHTGESGAAKADFAQGVHRFGTVEGTKSRVSGISHPVSGLRCFWLGDRIPPEQDRRVHDGLLKKITLVFNGCYLGDW